MISAFAACLLTAFGFTPADTLNFHRTYINGEKAAYRVVLKIQALNATADALIQQVAQKKTAESKPRLSFTTPKFEATGSSAAASDKPLPLTVVIGANNLPEKWALRKTDMMYMFLFLAAMTADKTIEVGKEFPVVWSAIGDLATTFKGTGTVTAIDAQNKTATISWKIDMSMGGTSVGDIVLKSVVDTGNCSLKACEGTMMKGQYTLTVKRQGAPEPAPR